MKFKKIALLATSMLLVAGCNSNTDSDDTTKKDDSGDVTPTPST